MTGKATPIALENDPLEPYFIAPGWRVGDLVFLSGQASIGEDGSIVGEGDFDAQLAQTFANIERVLTAAGSDLSKVVKVVIYMTDMTHFPKIVEARKRYFVSPYPADTTLEVKGLALPELMVEIEVTATV
ncbi:RidA family protein [Erythrobacter sp.]|jgi:enamine deaminase RidA (YjgF/YER057c/UK114 family)|uniref:RidA family protein n=1 Tax=Erythrobacter sp. TaxID=1042 RepID=UPI002EC3263A|nr:RidA family protein [Erythrobacter sp.]